MEIKYIDIHSHLGFGDYQNDFDDVLKRMHEAGVGTITVGTDLKSSIEAVKIAEANENVWACIGAHPNEGGEFNADPSQMKSQFDGASFEELVKNPKVVAIGECGLDYYVDPKSKVESQKSKVISEEEKERQKFEFIKQIEFAIKYKKPLMLHIRDAYDDAYKILSKYKGKVRANLHFFTGNSELAKKFIDIGFTISFPGVITFAKETQEAVKNIPLDKIHAETDSPFVTPVPYRGKRNEPSYVVEVVKKIAEIRGEDLNIVQKQLLENSKKFFNILT